MRNMSQPIFRVVVFFIACLIWPFPSVAKGPGPLEETFVRGVPCGHLLAKLTLLESCEELELFFSKWEPRADQCDPLAMTLIGLKYFQHGPTKQKAPEYFVKAAQQDFGPAQLELGMLYEKGDCLPQDNVQAFLWYSLAAAKGEGKAVSGLRNLERRMDSQSLLEARQLLENWKPVPCTPQPFPK